MRRLLPLALLVALAAPGLAPETEAQCAMCKATLEGSPEGRAGATQLNRAILVMLAAPYLVAGAFVIALFKRRLGARLAAARSRLAARLPRPAVARRPSSPQ